MKRPTRKNRNKRPNIKIKGEPRFYDNHIDVDIELFRKKWKKSRKRNGGGDFSKENCDATPLTKPIGFDNIVAMDNLYRRRFESAPQRGALFKSVTGNLVEESIGVPIEFLNGVNLQPIDTTNNKGSGSIVKITKCISPTSDVNEFALRISRTSVSIDQLSDEENRQKFQPIVDEYNRQIELSRHNYTPKLFYVCFLHIKFIRNLLGPTHSITVGTTGEQYCLCSVMEKVQTITEVNIEHVDDVIQLVDDVVKTSKIVFIDIKPENIGYNSKGQMVFLDVESKYCCRLSELSLDYMSSKDISSFCIFLMRYIFISFVKYRYRLSEAIDLSKLIELIKAINSKTFNLFGEATPFLQVVAIIHTLQDTEYRFFPERIFFKAIINEYIWKPAVEYQTNTRNNEESSKDPVLQSFYKQTTLRQKLGEVTRNREIQTQKYITKLETHKRASRR